MITSQDIREKFVNYFASKGHEKIESSSIIPQNDPTLLFANAGMNQFKDYFTGKANPKSKRAVSIQKCVRAGGKHNDLENVGLTARHHTFFEMLGNFSFGDYFKQEAIEFAWEFLTKELKIPENKLYVTVHDSDQEAFDIWNKSIGLAPDRIFYMGDKDNFWEMGEIGPCGPCSEIFFDHGEEYSDGSDTSKCLLNDESRYVEVWNLVFMQYEKSLEDGTIVRKDLPKPSIDTGTGLERLTACLQNVYWNYDIDTFDSIKKSLEKISKKKYSDPANKTSMRIVCDHIRAASMLITDGVIPSNEGRGYVLRRIIRRAIRHMSELGVKDNCFYQLVPAVFDKLAKEYPQNAANASLAEKLLKLEEEKFRKTLNTGLQLLEQEIKKLGDKKELPGKIAFKLYDTYGFPFDLTQVILEEHNLSVNEADFDSFMQKQKAASKASSNFTIAEDNLKTFYSIKEKAGETQFCGYDQIEMDAKLIALEITSDFAALIFKETPFYPEGGGQTGDQGDIFYKDELVAKVLDTQKPVEGLIVHFCEILNLEKLKLNECYKLQVNFASREMTKRNHSATHLLQSALIQVLGDHIKQAGSRVSRDSLRFDFTHPEALTKEQLKAVAKLVNEKINAELPVSASLMNKKEATAKGAMALFGEKYGSEVRVLEMGDFSLELCGGTHVANTREIGFFIPTLETSLSSGVRRIEALTSTEAMKYLQHRSEILEQVEKFFSTGSDQVFNRLETMQSDLKKKNKEMSKLQDKIQNQAAENLFDHAIDLGKEFKLVLANMPDAEPKDFRSLSDKFIDKNKNDVLLIYALSGDKVSYLMRTDKKNKYPCNKIIKTAQEIINGRGGGKPDMVQGSGEAAEYKKFLLCVENLLKEI